MTWLFALGGMLCLCLSMTRHQRDLLVRPLSPRWAWIVWGGGWIALALSFAIAVSGGAIAILYWIGEQSVAALVVVALCWLIPVLRGRGQAGRR